MKRWVLLNRHLTKWFGARLLILMIAIGWSGSVLPRASGQQRVTASAPKLRIAVQDLSGSALKFQTTDQENISTTTVALPPPAEFARGLTEMLTTALVETERFIVLERAAIDKVTGEQDFGASGRVNQETAAASGKIIGAQLLITGDITEFTYNQTSVGGTFKPIKILKAKSDRVTAMVALDLRLIDAVTGEVVFSRRSEGKASMSGASAELTRGNQEFSIGGFKNTPLGQASREAITGAVTAILSSLKEVAWSGRIVDVRDGLVYINAGAEQGVRSGMEFEVYAQQPALVDPDTGKTLGQPERKIGVLRIQSVEDKYAVAEIISGSGFARNHLLRLKGQAGKP